MKASVEGNVEIVEKMLKKGADPNYSYKSGRFFYKSPLRCAVSEGHVDIVKVLLAAGANANFCGNTYSGATLISELSVDIDSVEAKIGKTYCAGECTGGPDDGAASRLKILLSNLLIVRDLLMEAGADVDLRRRLHNECVDSGVSGVEKMLNAMGDKK